MRGIPHHWSRKEAAHATKVKTKINHFYQDAQRILKRAKIQDAAQLNAFARQRINLSL